MSRPLQLLAGFLLAFSPAVAGADRPATAASASGGLGVSLAAAIPAAPRFFASRLGPSSSVSSRDDASSLLGLEDDELMRLLEIDPASLGSLSIGGPGSGRLFNGVELQQDPRWFIGPSAAPWATSETLQAVQTAIDAVHQLFPETPPIYIGDMSDRDGGRLKRHESHQSGRDADLGFYFKDGARTCLATGTASNLDLARNWALVRALVVRTDVESIFLDTRIQRALYKYALSVAEDSEWLGRIFGFVKGSRDAIVKHIAGHRNHYHVRFFNPVAQELGRRAHPLLVQLEILEPPIRILRHRVRPGETIGHLAARYATTVESIMRANGLRTSRLRARRSYRIPVRGAVASTSDPLVIRPRLLPPE